MARGLYLEGIRAEDTHSTIDEYRLSKSREIKGRKWVFWGVVLEVFLAFVMAFKEADEIRKLETTVAKSNPLNQPVSEVFVIMRIVVNAKDYNPENPVSLANTTMSFGSFRLLANQSGLFKHVDNVATSHVNFYEIVVKFEQSLFPAVVWNDINSTNEDLSQSVTVSNAIVSANLLNAYIEFIPRNTPIVKGAVRFFINGFTNNIEMGSNCVNHQYSEWNPDKPGLFLTVTNASK